MTDEQQPVSEEPTRRDFLFLATGAFAAVGAANVVWPLIDQMNPDASVKALASIEVDLAAIETGQSVKGNIARFGNFALCAAANEHRLTAPCDGHALARFNGAQIDLDRGQGFDGSVRVHLVDERPHDIGGTDGGKGTGCQK